MKLNRKNMECAVLCYMQHYQDPGDFNEFCREVMHGYIDSLTDDDDKDMIRHKIHVAYQRDPAYLAKWRRYMLTVALKVEKATSTRDMERLVSKRI